MKRENKIFYFVIIFLLLCVPPARATYKELEEEGQRNLTNITGNAADDQLLVGSGTNAMAYKSLSTCSTALTSKLLYSQSSNAFSCGTDQSSILFTDAGGQTYLTSTTDDFAIGATGLTAPFSVDESANTVRIGEGANSNGVLVMYASDADVGTITYTTNDSWNFSGGNVGWAVSSPAAKLDIDSTAAAPAVMRLDGPTETTEIFDFYLENQGNLYFMTTSGSASSYLDFRPEDDQYGLILRESTGAATTPYANFYMNPAGSDYFSITISNVTSGSALTMTGSPGSYNVGVGTSAPANTLEVNGGIRMSVVNVATTTTANMDMNTSGDIGYDMAEAMWVDSSVEEADIVSVDRLKGLKLIRSQEVYDPGLIGVASSMNTSRAIPICQLGSPEDMEKMFPGRRYKFISLAGQVEVKVNLDNGPIETGDWITSSSIPGVGMKATSHGSVVGKAMESFREIKNGQTFGKILIFVALQELFDQNLEKDVNKLTQETPRVTDQIELLVKTNQDQQQLMQKIQQLNEEQKNILDYQGRMFLDFQGRLTKIESRRTPKKAPKIR